VVPNAELTLDLTAAVCNADLPKITRLLNWGADIECRSTGGFGPLAFASRLGHNPVVSLLIERGADIESRTTKHETPLLLAVKWDHAAVAHTLLQAGAIVDARNDQQQTPLILAAMAGHTECISDLLSHCDKHIDATDKSSATALRHAARHVSLCFMIGAT